ncbi:MAG: hypothetical protein ACJ741_02780 [Pyrinomonadaceae bacterium]
MRHARRSNSLLLLACVVALCALVAVAFVVRSTRTGGALLHGGVIRDGEASGVEPPDAGDYAVPPPSRPRATRGSQFYSAPDGSADGDGSKSRPWDLGSALSKQSKLKPGDTLWLRGGVYRGTFRSRLAGTAEKPTLVAQSPGERATIDGSLKVFGEWATYWGFEVTNSNADRTAERPTGVEIEGAHTRFVNLVVHDTGNGFGFWSSAVDSELYGNLIYHNGWSGIDRGHGHGIYTQNEEGTKLIRDNVIFEQYGWGIHAYTEEGALRGLYFEGNVSFDNGAPADARYDNILVGGRQPAERVSLVSNFTYETPASGETKPNVRLNYESTDNKDLTAKDNYFAGGDTVASVGGWLSVTMTGNTFRGRKQLVELSLPQGVAPSAYAWDGNTYCGSDAASPFGFEGRALDFTGWQGATGFDRTSSGSAAGGQACGVRVFVRPNLYEQGRANVVVYNWERRGEVEVDVSGVLVRGAKFEVRDARNYFGAPVVAGTYDGKPLRLPVGARRVALPVGAHAASPQSAPEFGVFVLLSAS